MMFHSGSVYSVQLLPFGSGKMEYYIRATDINENVRIEDNGGIYYSMTVIEYSVPTTEPEPEPTSSPINFDLIEIFGLCLALFVIRKKQK